jgi:hypothetical protein
LRLRGSPIILFVILVKRIMFTDIHGFLGLNHRLDDGFRNFHNTRPFGGYRRNSRRPIGMGWCGVKGDRQS